MYIKEHWNDSETRKPPVQVWVSFHYRLLLKDISPREIPDFQNARELVTVIRDASRAFDHAFQRASNSHGDISVHNIAIREHRDKVVAGVIIDWDLPSKSHRDRIGTLAFVPANFNIGPPVQMREDHVESFYHVMSYLASVFLQHNTNTSSLAQFICVTFLHQVIPNRMKDNFVASGCPAVAAFNPRISDILKTMAYVLTARHAPAEMPPLFTSQMQDGEGDLFVTAVQGVYRQKLQLQVE
ncbi:hypothetical protein BDN72DRAFT_882447 [Pluteus cervinus]|uniref:Uncharacterized protein n=1 Tax=Pluteus cervinus TaxID=181527 RepID=A0ACD3AB64_9AGAR|nr:hypothetical protein BDN72DRAFT_882447 [Pluteus cervinus]